MLEGSDYECTHMNLSSASRTLKLLSLVCDLLHTSHVQLVVLGPGCSVALEKHFVYAGIEQALVPVLSRKSVLCCADVFYYSSLSGGVACTL